MNRWTSGAIAGLAAFAAVTLLLRGGADARGPEGAGRAGDAVEADAAAPERLVDLDEADRAGAMGDDGGRCAVPGPASGIEAASRDDRAPGHAPGPSLVRGVVVGPDGTPLDGRATVFASDASGRTPVTGTDDGGRFLFTGLAPGRLEFRTYALGGRPATASVLVEEGGVHSVELVVAPAVLVRVRALDGGGEPLRDAVRDVTGGEVRLAAIATERRPEEVLDPRFAHGNNPYGIGATWDAHRFGLDPDPKPGSLGVLAVERDAPFHVSLVVGQITLATQRVAPGADEVEFSVEASELEARLASVSVKVVGAADGAPVAADVRIARGAGGARRPAPAATDDDGVVSLGAVWPGPITLRVDAPGLASVERDLVLRPGENLRLGDLVLGPPLTLDGRVESPDGEALAVEVRCELLGADLGPVRRWTRASGPDGAFRFEGLPAGRYTVRIEGDDEGRVPFAARTVWTSGLTSVDARAGEPPTVDIVAERAVETVFDLEGLPDGARLTVVDAEGRVLRRARPDWNVWALKLPRGAKELVVRTADGEELARRAFVVDGEARRISAAGR